jgi:endonuclease III
MTESHASVVKELLERFGRTYADQAGIRLADKPSPLYELLVLATLLSARITADVAVSAAHELFTAGYRTPERMQQASWQDRVDALGRGHYRRYDESTATRLDDEAGLLRQRWRGDLRKLRDEAGSEPKRIHELLTEFKGIGPTGADIFLREVQGVWPKVAPYVDSRVREGAALLRLPTRAADLADLAGSAGQAGSPHDLARLASALVRVAHDPNAAEQILTGSHR